MDVESIPEEATIYKANGCPKCNHRGYSGRTTVCELLMITDEIRPLILAKSDAATVKKSAVQQGMRTLRQDGIQKVFRGITSFEEIIRVINEEEDQEVEVK